MLRTSTRPRALAGLAILGGLGIVGCAPAGPDAVVVYDLVHSLPAARRGEPTGRLDLGTEEARAHLGAGWSWNERAGDATTFVWGVGAESRIRLSLNGLRPVGLRFRALAFEPPGGAREPPALELLIDGAHAGEVELTGGFEVHGREVDPRLWSLTESVLQLRYRPEPAPAGPHDRRPLAVAWDWLELEEVEPGPAASSGALRTSARRLRLPVGLRLDYPLDLEPGSRLRLASVRPHPAALIAALAVSGQPPRLLRLDGGLEVDLGIERFTPGVLSLLADPAAVPAGEDLVLEAPRVVLAASRARPSAPGEGTPHHGG
ncbi:MAG TPA: hypothetical protein VMV46_20045 [Thermoanaerobaculia bacterium]|nr:hypothetical protein [Thermoanaerobaculia bacterium]